MYRNKDAVRELYGKMLVSSLLYDSDKDVV